MEVATIRAGRRKYKGSNRVPPFRAKGLIPAVLYGGKETPINLAVEEREMEGHLRQHHKVYNMTLDGGQVPVYLQDVQWDIITDRPLHMDFLRIDMRKAIHTHVELAYIGHPVGATHGGSLVKDHVSLKISCLPGQMPEEIEVKVKELDIGDTLLARDLEMPEGVTMDVSEDVIICHVAAPSAKLEEETPEEVPEGGEETTDEDSAKGDEADKPGGKPRRE